MTSRDFVYWLNGFFEMTDPKTLDEKQTAMIKEHLALVFTKVTGKEEKVEKKPEKELLTDGATISKQTIEEFRRQLRPSGHHGTYCYMHEEIC